MSESRYQMYRQAGRCGNCGAVDERVESGKAMCDKCAALVRLYRNNKYNKTAKFKRKRHGDYMYDIARELCPTCHKPNPDAPNRITCPECRRRALERARAKRATGVQ